MTEYKVNKDPKIDDTESRRRMWKALYGDAPMPSRSQGILLRYSGSFNREIPSNISVEETLEEIYQ